MYSTERNQMDLTPAEILAIAQLAARAAAANGNALLMPQAG